MTDPNASPPPLTDFECLRGFRRRGHTACLRVLVERHQGLVYASALRRTGNADVAAEVTRAVFLVLARRARRLPKRTVLAEWLFQMVRIAVRKRSSATWWSSFVDRFRRRTKTATPTDAPVWSRLSPVIDRALDRLSVAQRQALLVQQFQGLELSEAAAVLRCSEKRVGKFAARALENLRRALRGSGIDMDAMDLADVIRAEGCRPLLEPAFLEELLAGVVATQGRRSVDRLARRVLNSLAWTRWRRRVVFGVPAAAAIVVFLVVAIWIIEGRDGHSRLMSMFLVGSVKHEGRTVPGLAVPARPWPAGEHAMISSARGIVRAGDLYQVTNIWPLHLRFADDQWKAVEPRRIAPLPHFMQPDGTVKLRNPEAQRSGLAGVLGFDFYWGHADLGFAERRFTNVAVRIKGNGTFLGSLYGDKRSYKVDLNKFVQGQRLGEMDELTLNNLINDYSCMSDALAYEFFREAGVPASRTAYAYVSMSVDGRWVTKPLGLYAMIEAVDADFALEHFGSRRVPIFKPVTYELFDDLGDDWAAYAEIYDLKTKATPEQERRVIDFARLLTGASDDEFARRVDEFLDLKAFARYLACEVLLSNYDGFLSNGQNFYLYLDPVSDRFGFIPWDLDLSWGGFFLLGTTRERERASIWHPWVGRHRLLERVMAMKVFREQYRVQLEELLATVFVPDRLFRRIDAIAAVIREPVAAESDFRLRKFEQAIREEPLGAAPDEQPHGANRPAHQLKRFVTRRAKSVREQLDGKAQGIVLERNQRR